MATAHNLEENVNIETTDRRSDQRISDPEDGDVTFDNMTAHHRRDPQQEPCVYNITTEPSRPGTVDSNTLELMLDQATQTFVPTSIFKHISRSLEKDCQVTICGASGEGKTTMALMLGQRYRKKGYELVFVNRLDVFKLGSCISSGQKYFLIFDDIFGSIGQFTDYDHIKDFCDSLKLHIEPSLLTRERDNFRADDIGQGLGPIEEINKSGSDKKKHSQALRVVFTAKPYNINEGMSMMQYQRLSSINEKTMVDLTLNTSYSHKEKIAIFQKHREMHPKKRPGDFVIGDAINQKPPLFGFPLTCRLFFEFPKFTEKAVDFFKHPLYYLRIELNDILSRKKDQAAALILVLLCEENIKLPELESPYINQKVDEMFLYVTSFANSASRSGTAAAAKNFRGTFLSRGDSLCFAHSSIYEACACALYRFNPSFVLKYCSLDFLYERLKPGNVEESGVSDNLHYLFVSVEYFNLVITRLITSMKQGIFSKTVAHPMNTNDNFVEKFMEELGKTSSESKDWILKKEKGKGFHYWIVRSKSTKLIQGIAEVLSINFTQDDISEAVFAAVECDNLPILKNLVERLEQNLDETDLNKLLLVSAESSSIEMVGYLLNMGAQITGTDTNNRNILHLLCIHDRSEILKAIIGLSGDRSGDLHNARNALDNDKRTPLMLAALHGTLDCFQQMQYDDKGDSTDCNGDHLIILACHGGNLGIVERVLTNGNINSRGNFGMTPLMAAAYKAQSEVFDLLVTKNADREDVDDNGNTLLHHACLGGSKHIAESLVTTENINTRGTWGMTPIMASALKARSEVFDLLSKKADKELIDKGQNSLLHYACLGGSKHIVERLVTPENIDTKGWVGKTPIMIAAYSAQSEVFDLLFSKSADTKCVDDHGNTLLHHACLGGSKHIVECLVTPKNINTKGWVGMTPIMFAANSAKSEVFDLLSSKKADRELIDKEGNSLLHYACLGGSKHIVERLVNPENINTKGRDGKTPIMIAAYSAQSEVFDLLSSKKADRELIDKEGNSLLHYACLGGSKHIVERLVTPENINTKGKDGKTPIMIAAYSAQSEVFDLLFSKSADTKCVDDHGNTLLHHAWFGGSKHIIERLVTPENINTKGRLGMTPIMFAANRARSEVFDFLLSKKADTEYVDDDGYTLLHHACVGGSKHIVKRIVTPENINATSKVGMTPIMFAANSAKSEVFDLLFSKKADKELIDKEGNSLLHYACLGGSKHIVERLVNPENINTKGKDGKTPIMIAAYSALSEVFDFLFSKSADTKCVDDHGNTLLHHACFGGSKHIVECLVTPKNINTKGLVGMTPIMFAANSAKSEVFDLLSSKKADRELIDKEGNSLLHYACLGGSKHIVERLVTPENINTKGRDGKTPIMIAAYSAQSEVFDLLFSKSADTKCVDDHGNTLLHHAWFGGSKHIIERLVTPENINTKGRLGMTPIANRARSEVFDFLLSKNADTEYVDDDGYTLLHHACVGGSKHIVKRIVTPENINAKSKVGMTPIMVAANSAKSEVFDLLFSKKADRELIDKEGNSLLHYACLGGSKHIVERLVTPENINTKGWVGYQ